ncbi:Uncharacterized protein SAPIO_CDS3363 [Scedosporium apiospermum]|uniref:Hyphal anastamosis-8 protein n=1 Tax=Pseudallescheria apiosperma TaxID=563466 RepID=A0A084GAL8_PSEDA|nr:Uncharacterized protein SAPIO_CDS3363 [Scedosporium apiospermum]KEZ44380.1 Uncharacterized protein SAPIO_CDS3363 [Scedosporium apiospermum]
MAILDEKRRPAALNLTPARSGSSSSSSSDSSLKPPRTPRFAEATSVHSPIDGDGRSPFADPVDASTKPQVADVGFGYITTQEVNAPPLSPRSPLKSAMRVPGTPGRRLDNPLSPTFREEDMLEKREARTDKEQQRDLKIKARVRMAKFALRGVNFSCSLIILSMLSASFSIFNATKTLPSQSGMPSWAKNTNTWPQKLVLAMACVSLIACIIVFLAYCRGGHRRAEKVSTYYTMFAIGWFIISMILWAVTAALYQHSRTSNNNKDMWGWSCVDNKRADVYQDKVDYALVCRLQNWTLICIIIEVVIEVICITLYSIVFYRYYTKRRLHKSMNLRDKARSDLYLAQLRTQSAPNTPGFGPKSPAFSQYALSPRFPPSAYRNLSDIEESPFTPGNQFAEPKSAFAEKQQSTFKLQAPPTKAPSATPKLQGGAFSSSPIQTRAPTPPELTHQQHAPVAAEEPVYEAVPIPGAYADAAVKSPPPNQTTFGQAR